MRAHKQLLLLSLLMAITLLLQACASSPQALLQARIQCNQEHIGLESAVKAYYLCVQEKAPFGAYEEEGLKEKSSPIVKDRGRRFADDIDFISRAPKADQSWLMMTLGSKALAAGDISLAYKLFEINARFAETIYGDSPQAKKARAAFRQEAEKRFIGENYERAMIFHYLGILDLMTGNYQNARAAFRASVLQDALAQNENYRQDFASSLWLRGWAAHCANSARAKADFNKANQVAFIPPPNRRDNLLVIAELGLGPFKIARGQHGETLSYVRQQPTPLEGAFKPARLGLFQANDLFFQATTRGERKFDEYLKAQSENKETAKNLGKASVITGLALLDRASEMENATAAGVVAVIGIGALVVGGVSYAVSAAINPTADTRTWRMMPSAIYLGSFQANARATNITSLRGRNRQLNALIDWVEDNRAELGIVFVNRGACRILWVRDKTVHQ